MKKHILISGAGIAGLTVAKLLVQQGHAITLIDRSAAFNKAGFLISLKSFGVKIIDEIGLMSKLQQESSPSETVDFLETNDHIIQKVSYDKINENMERSILISRGGLHHVLYEDMADEVNFIPGTTIVHVDQLPDGATVLLSNGGTIQADLVIISEGLRSATREKYFNNCQLQDFNIIYLGGKLKQHHSLSVGNFKIYIDVNKMLSIYPIAPDEIAIQCYIHNMDDIGSIKNNMPAILKNAFGNYNHDVQELLKDLLRNGLLFADKMGMVHAPNLANGRLVLLGDAGYCPTALSGMGASLSIYGARALAHFIEICPGNLFMACQNYNRLMQPVIEKFQTNAKANAASFIPKNKTDLDKFVAFFRSASEPDVQKIMTQPITLTEEQANFIVS